MHSDVRAKQIVGGFGGRHGAGRHAGTGVGDGVGDGDGVASVMAPISNNARITNVASYINATLESRRG